MSVCAVVVTRNRRDLLSEVLAAIGAQTRPVDALLVVDNASTDGTADLLDRRHETTQVVRLARNEGGAGGFHEGLRVAHAAGHDLIWFMDDDVVPEPAALAQLLEAREAVRHHDPMLLASKVVWLDGRLHPMNRTTPDWKAGELLVEVAEGRSGLIPIRAATFTSVLVDRRAIDVHGLPDKRYFLWSDDIEYTARILRHETGFLVTGSVVLHKTPSPHTAATGSTERYYFHVRNTLYMLRSTAWTPLEKTSLARRLVHSIWNFLREARFRPQALAIVGHGLRDGVRGARQPHGPYMEP